MDSSGSVLVTLTSSEGTFGTPADGAGVGAGVTETLVNSTTITLIGTINDINTYLNTASNIQYTGTLNDNGGDTATVTVQINDGDVSGNVTVGTINLDIAAVNDAPTATGSSITMEEDTSRTFVAADFNFSDVDSGDTLTSVRIDTLTVGSGALRLSGVRVTASDVISIADINAGNLVYKPAADANGNDLLTFTFSVNDGTEFSAAPSAIAVDVSDVFDASTTPVKLNGGAGDDTLSGELGSDTIRGGGGDDIVSGQGGSDRLLGGSGNDTLDGGEGDDAVWGGGNDVLGGGAGNDTVRGGSGEDTLFGGGGADRLEGGSGNDLIFNGAGNDTVAGGFGDDTLWAGAGDDQLTGGDGADLFVFGSANGNDTITDFSVTDDTLDFSFSSLDDLAAVQVAASAATQGGSSGVLIDLGGGDSVFIENLTLADLDTITMTF